MPASRKRTDVVTLERVYRKVLKLEKAMRPVIAHCERLLREKETLRKMVEADRLEKTPTLKEQALWSASAKTDAASDWPIRTDGMPPYIVKFGSMDATYDTSSIVPELIKTVEMQKAELEQQKPTIEERMAEILRMHEDAARDKEER